MSKSYKYDDRVAQLYQAGMSIPAVAKTVKIGNKSVMDALKRKGVETRKPGPRLSDPKVDDHIVALHRDGLTGTDIATELGICVKTVSVTRKRLGLNSYPGVAPILSVAEVERLLSLARQGWRQIDLAKEFGIAQNTVSNYLIKHGFRRQKQHTNKGN